MADVTHYVALPFAISDDGPEAREAVECTSAIAAWLVQKFSHENYVTLCNRLELDRRPLEPACVHNNAWPRSLPL